MLSSPTPSPGDYNAFNQGPTWAGGTTRRLGGVHLAAPRTNSFRADCSRIHTGKPDNLSHREALHSLLSSGDSSLSHLAPVLLGESLASLAARIQDSRPAALTHLKLLGVQSLRDRQSLINRVSRAAREGLLRCSVRAPVASDSLSAVEAALAALSALTDPKLEAADGDSSDASTHSRTTAVRMALLKGLGLSDASARKLLDRQPLDAAALAALLPAGELAIACQELGMPAAQARAVCDRCLDGSPATGGATPDVPPSTQPPPPPAPPPQPSGPLPPPSPDAASREAAAREALLRAASAARAAAADEAAVAGRREAAAAARREAMQRLRELRARQRAAAVEERLEIERRRRVEAESEAARAAVRATVSAAIARAARLAEPRAAAESREAAGSRGAGSRGGREGAGAGSEAVRRLVLAAIASVLNQPAQARADAAAAAASARAESQPRRRAPPASASASSSSAAREGRRAVLAEAEADRALVRALRHRGTPASAASSSSAGSSASSSTAGEGSRGDGSGDGSGFAHVVLRSGVRERVALAECRTVADLLGVVAGLEGISCAPPALSRPPLHSSPSPLTPPLPSPLPSPVPMPSWPSARCCGAAPSPLASCASRPSS